MVGIGNELNGDDAAGIAVVRALESELKTHAQTPSVCVVQAGTVPENFTGTLRRFHPDLVILVDAAQMDSAPGTIRWYDSESAAGFSASTHTLPLNLFALYLSSEIRCEVKLLGIQPARNSAMSISHGTGLHLTAPVEKATRQIVSEISSLLESLTEFGRTEHTVLTLEP